MQIFRSDSHLSGWFFFGHNKGVNQFDLYPYITMLKLRFRIALGLIPLDQLP